MIIRSSSIVLPTSSFPGSKTPEFPVVITRQPSGQSVATGQTATFSVLVQSNGLLSYQWQTTDHRLALLSGFHPLPGAEVDGFWTIVGATKFSYTTPVLQALDNGTQFLCLITSTNSVPQSVNSVNGTETLFTQLMSRPATLLVH